MISRSAQQGIASDQVSWKLSFIRWLVCLRLAQQSSVFIKHLFCFSLGFGISILIWIWSLVFAKSIIWILTLSWFWRCKEYPSPLNPDLGLWRMLEVPDWGFGGRWRFLAGVWHLDLDLDMITGIWYNQGLKIGSLSGFGRCKEHPCPLSPHLGLERKLMFWTGVWDLYLDFNKITGL